MRLLGRASRDKRLLGLIGRYLRAGVLVGEHIEPRAKWVRRKAGH
jgi:RNA-directed DNA polymerase